MKKKLFPIVIVAAGWSYSQANNEVALSDVALSNVEALAGGESGGQRCDAGGLGASSCSISQNYGGGFGSEKD